MQPFAKATFGGLVLGIVVFLLSFWSVYGVLWHNTGMDHIPPDSNPGVVLGAYAAIVKSLVVGTILGSIAWLLLGIWLYRRLASRVAIR